MLKIDMKNLSILHANGRCRLPALGHNIIVSEVLNTPIRFTLSVNNRSRIDHSGERH